MIMIMIVIIKNNDNNNNVYQFVYIYNVIKRVFVPCGKTDEPRNFLGRASHRAIG